MGTIVDTLREGVQRQADTVRSFATTPMGPFAAIDEVVRNTRTTVKAIVGTRMSTLRGFRRF